MDYTIDAEARAILDAVKHSVLVKTRFVLLSGWTKTEHVYIWDCADKAAEAELYAYAHRKGLTAKDLTLLLSAYLDAYDPEYEDPIRDAINFAQK